MTRSTVAAAVAGCAALTITLAACSSSGGTSSPAGGNTATGGNAAGATVTVKMTGGHLVGPNGLTLYTNTADTSTHLICTGSCLAIWPPVYGKPTAGAGVTASELGTIARGSQSQLTFEGHPLYTFKSDAKPGDVKGAGLVDAGGTWHPAGAPVMPKRTQGGGKSSGSGGGYGGSGGGSGGGY